MSLWTPPRTWAALEKMTSALFNYHIAENLGFLHDRVQAGWVDITPTASGVQTSVDVPFQVPFLVRPYVFVGYHGGSPGQGAGQVEGVGGDHESEEGFRATLTRNNTTTTRVNWIAIEQ